MDYSLIITSLIIILSIIIAYYIISSLFFDSNFITLQSNMTDAKKQQIISEQDIGEINQGQNYTLSWWMYIDDFNYRNGQEKIILQRGRSFKVKLAPNQASLVVETEEISNDGLIGEAIIKRCVIDNIDLQRWVFCSIVVSTKYIDIYYNGKLARSCVYNNPTKAYNGDLLVTPNINGNDAGFSGYMSRIEFSKKPATSEEIFNKYNAGPIKKSLFGLLFGIDEIDIKYRNMGGSKSTFNISF